MLLVAACAPPPPPVAAKGEGTQSEVKVERVAAAAPSQDKNRGELEVLIGPESEACAVRDVRNVKLPAGLSRVTVAGVPSDVEAGNVSVRASGAQTTLETVELRPYTQPITKERLLEPSIGKEVTAYVWDPTKNAEVAQRGTLLGLTADGPIVALGGAVRVLSDARISVPTLPSTLRAEPMLEVLVRAAAETKQIELSYTTRLVRAALEYQLTRAPGAANAELSGLVGISNEMGTSLEAAHVTLTSNPSETSKFAQQTAAQSAADERTMTTTRVDLEAPVTLAHGERALVKLFGPREVALTRKVIIEGRGLPYDGAPDEVGSASVHAVLDARVTNAEPLSRRGMVGGQAHLFERSASAPAHAYGTAVARPLPGAMGLRVDLGDETKVPNKRKLVQKRTLSRCVIETSWEVTITNSTEEPLPVEDVEPVDGKYEILDSSLPPIAKEIDHFAFGATVPANGETKLKFKVRTSACSVQRSRYWQPSWSKSSWSKPSKSGS